MLKDLKMNKSKFVLNTPSEKLSFRNLFNKENIKNIFNGKETDENNVSQIF